MNRLEKYLTPDDHQECLAVLADRLRVLDDRVGALYDDPPPEDMLAALRTAAAAAERAAEILDTLVWEPRGMADGIVALVAGLSEQSTEVEVERVRGSVSHLAWFLEDSLKEDLEGAA